MVLGQRIWRRRVRSRSRRWHEATANRDHLQAWSRSDRPGHLEGMGTKGLTRVLTSIAGCYLCWPPGLTGLRFQGRSLTNHTASSQGDHERLNAPGRGFIIRTAAVDRNVQELQSDLAYLVRLWEVSAIESSSDRAPVEVYMKATWSRGPFRHVHAGIDASISTSRKHSPRLRSS